MKGFLIAVVLIGGAFYWLEKGGSANGGGGSYASATGVAVEVTPDNFDYTVTHNEAPVLAYFWASW
jgi:thioredoxin-like negative regulator of GroEL